MTRVAAVDCGTNSLRLLIADVDVTGGVLTDVDRRMEVVRLGQGVDATGRFDPQALERTLSVAADYADRCRDAGVEAVRFVATSATRDAADRDVFIGGIRERFGVDPEVISGDAEARLSFDGATRGLNGVGEDTTVLVVDIGGGSTEFVLGSRRDGVHRAVSVDMGCVRLHERHSGAGSWSATDADGDVLAGVEAAASAVDWRRVGALVGVAGTVTTVTAHALGLTRYDPGCIHGADLSLAEVVGACSDLLSMSLPERRALPYMHPGRADVIDAGALVWQRILERVGADAGLSRVLTSEHDILDGIAWSLA